MSGEITLYEPNKKLVVNGKGRWFCKHCFKSFASK